MEAAASDPVRVVMIGVGGMARHHILQMLKQADTTTIPVVCEPSPQQYDAHGRRLRGSGRRSAAEPARPGPAAARSTPGSSTRPSSSRRTPIHHDQTVACMEAGLDVLLEKPMVMNAAEARSLIAARDRTGRLLVVAFPGSLSPQIRTAVNMLRAGELGALLSISATVWQNWGPNTANTWRQTAGDRGRRLPVRHRRAHAQHRRRPGRARTSSKWRPGWTTTTARWILAQR